MLIFKYMFYDFGIICWFILDPFRSVLENVNALGGSGVSRMALGGARGPSGEAQGAARGLTAPFGARFGTFGNHVWEAQG